MHRAEMREREITRDHKRERGEASDGEHMPRTALCSLAAAAAGATTQAYVGCVALLHVSVVPSSHRLGNCTVRSRLNCRLAVHCCCYCCCWHAYACMHACGPHSALRGQCGCVRPILYRRRAESKTRINSGPNKGSAPSASSVRHPTVGPADLCSHLHLRRRAVLLVAISTVYSIVSAPAWFIPG